VRVGKPILVSLILGLGTFPVTALTGGWQQSKSAQAGGQPPQGGMPPGVRSSGPSNHGSNFQFHLNGPGPHRGDWLRKYGALPDNQQEQQLRQDPGFRSLAPQEQQKLLDRLHSFNSLSPNGKAKLLDRMETYEHLTPAQQQKAQGLFQRYKSLPDDRRNRISQAYHQLRDLPPDQRSQLLSSDEYRNNFTDEERDLLRGMTDLNVPHND
jgi:hypothetical protein